ncbi:MAG: glycosyltransferase family 4 protein [Candidatus Scalindua sp.]|nr:glycosyltransferase family 4 protein [Candidatus Scalindua sp.]
MEPKNSETSPIVSVMGRIVSREPIVTISKCTYGAPLGIASVAQSFFRNKRAFHIISNTWHCQDERRLAALTNALKRLSESLVDNSFIFLGNTQYETWLLSRNGIPSIHSSELISIDESVFKPMSEKVHLIKPTEAIYLARLAKFKRHELAGYLPDVALVYGNRGNEPGQYTHLKRTMPNWRFINHEIGNGKYHRLNKVEVASSLNCCSTGLCLSKEEGAMRASMEYLLCGLPVVSTKSIGGRSRYFDHENCVYAEDSPESVAAAVNEIVRRETDRQQIRDSVMRKIIFDREDFVSTVNNIISSTYGINELFGSYTSFIGYMKYHPAYEILRELETL